MDRVGSAKLSMVHMALHLWVQVMSPGEAHAGNTAGAGAAACPPEWLSIGEYTGSLLMVSAWAVLRKA